MKQEGIGGLIAGIALALLLTFAMTGAYLWSAPRTMNGEGMIPKGCTLLRHIVETTFGPGEHPVCFVPGAVVPGAR